MVWLKIEESFNLKSFCKDVSISGLANFLETKDRKCKFFWIVANVACILSAGLLCYNSCAYYWEHQVKTTMKVIWQDAKPNFPAITFCTTSLMRTSFKHNSTQFGDFNSDLMATYDPGDAKRVKKFESYSCKDTAVFPSDRFQTPFNSYYGFLTMYALTYQDIVLLCWFAGNRVPCTNNDRYFKLALTDLGSCFTFNEIRKTPSESELFGPLKLNGMGPRQGFKFLMNVRQEEYCTPYNVYNGIGFLFGLKENYAPYDFNCEKGFFKMPVGYDVNINVKPTKFIRNTEHLKKCTNKPLVDYDGKHPIPYYRGFCLVAELVKLFYHTCHCILPSYDFYTPYMNRHNFEFSDFPKNLTKEIICDQNDKFIICSAIILQKFYLNKLWQILPLCPLPCFETVYTITFSMKKLSWKSLRIEKSVDSALVERAYHNATVKVNLSIEAWVEQNLIMANFYYGDSFIDVFIDDQAFGFSDLVIYIANVLGLFYGISFVTLFEFSYGIFRLLFEFIVYKFKRKMQQ